MSLLTIAQLTAQIDTDVSGTDLQQIIDAAERDVTEYVGAPSSDSIELDGHELDTVIRLPRQATSITSIVEFTGTEYDPVETALASDDYELSTDGWWLRRLSAGTNPRASWGNHLEIAMVPASDDDRRRQVAIELCRLELNHTGYSRERVGDWSAESDPINRQRERILSRLDDNGGID